MEGKNGERGAASIMAAIRVWHEYEEVASPAQIL